MENLLGRFGRYLAQRRREQNLTLRAFADRAKMPFSNLYQLEELRKNPRLTELEQLAKAFDEPLAKFLEPLLQSPPPEPSNEIHLRDSVL